MTLTYKCHFTWNLKLSFTQEYVYTVAAKPIVAGK